MNAPPPSSPSGDPENPSSWRTRWRLARKVEWEFFKERMAWMVLGGGLIICADAVGLLGFGRDLTALALGIPLIVVGAWLTQRWRSS